MEPYEEKVHWLVAGGLIDWLTEFKDRRMSDVGWSGVTG